jgi:hypothetical protein
MHSTSVATTVVLSEHYHMHIYATPTFGLESARKAE